MIFGYWYQMFARTVSCPACTVSLLLKLNSSLQPYVKPGGTIIVEINRALYGCIESVKLWFEELTETLKNMGFSPNDCDLCL